MSTLRNHQRKIINEIFDNIDSNIKANTRVEQELETLRDITRKIKSLKSLQDKLQDSIKGFMGDSEILLGKFGDTIATFKTVKGYLKLNSKIVKEKYESIYNECVELTKDYRKFSIS